MLVAAMPIYIGVRMKVFSNFPFVLSKNGFPKLFYIHAVSIMKYRVEQTGSGRGAENGFLRALGRGARAGIFRRVDYVIRFEQNSVVKPVHIRIGDIRSTSSFETGSPSKNSATSGGLSCS